MRPIRIAILGASEIAFRRFLPAISLDKRFSYSGVAFYRSQDEEKVKLFQKNFGGEIFCGFDRVFENPDIDAVYVPQPPALHYQFGAETLASGKHLFMEKPFTNSLHCTTDLLNEARSRGLGVIENYMFRFHRQIAKFLEIVQSGEIGEIDHFEVRFSFPLRQQNDFRYIKKMGGGALLDCGGYVIMLSDILVGGDGILQPLAPIFKPGFEVDMAGSGVMKSEGSGKKCFFSFGMDDEYACYAKAFGSKGVLMAPRVLTAPSDFDVKFQIFEPNGSAVMEEIEVGRDDSFLKSIDNFYQAITIPEKREENYCKILKQAKFVDLMQNFGGLK